MKFNVQHNYTKHSQPEQNHAKCLVEKAGYISAQKRIESMILAGQRLVDYRKNQFDFPDGKIDEDFDDPTRIKSFDLADATQLQLRTEASLKARQKLLKDSESVDLDETDINPVKHEKSLE